MTTRQASTLDGNSLTSKQGDNLATKNEAGQIQTLEQTFGKMGNRAGNRTAEQTNRKTDKKTDKQTDRRLGQNGHASKQAAEQTDSQTDRRPDRRASTPTITSIPTQCPSTRKVCKHDAPQTSGADATTAVRPEPPACPGIRAIFGHHVQSDTTRSAQGFRP